MLTFVRDGRGEVRAQAWQLSGSVGSSRMVPLPVAPSARLLEICLPGHAGSGVLSYLLLALILPQSYVCPKPAANL